MADVREDGLVGVPYTAPDLIARLDRSPVCDPARRTHFRLATRDDADYIHRLRSDPGLGRYLSAGAQTAADQARWLETYKRREAAGAEAYFMIIHEGRPHGAIRIYDFLDTADGPSFGWGSLVIEPPRPKGLVKATLMYVLEAGLGALGFAQSHFEVMKDNVAVADLYMRSGAKVIAESDEKLFLLFTRENLAAMKRVYADAWADHFRPS